MNTSCRLIGKSGIYAIISGSRFYVGSSKNLNDRYKRHKSEIIKKRHSNKKLQSVVSGDASALFIVVELCEPSLLLEREQYWIDCCDATNREFGLNLNPVANKPPMTEDIRRRISERQKGKPARNKGVKMSEHQRLSLVGRKHSDETKLKMSKSKLQKPTRYWLGRKHSDETRRKIGEAQIGRVVTEETKLKKSNKGVFINPMGEYVTVLNISAFSKENGLDKARMCELYNGTRKSHKGWRFLQKLDYGTR